MINRDADALISALHPKLFEKVISGEALYKYLRNSAERKDMKSNLVGSVFFFFGSILLVVLASTASSIEGAQTAWFLSGCYLIMSLVLLYWWRKQRKAVEARG